MPRPSTLADTSQFSLALEAAPEAALPGRLRRLGLPATTPITLTRNRSVLVSLAPGTGLRIHAGYAWASDDILAAVIRYLAPRVPRGERLVARRRFLSFPVERHAPTRAPRTAAPVPSEHRPLLDRLDRLHEILNKRHFDGTLSTIAIRLSDKMSSRLGEYRAPSDGLAGEIRISRRHLRRDGWGAAAETLLHEMVHQWQAETGRPLDHGAGFRRKAQAVGISPSATAAASYIPAPSHNGIIA